MKQKQITVLYRRKRRNQTGYRRRLALLLSQKPRLVLRFTNRRIIAQLIEFSGGMDKVLVGVDSSTLSKFGWSFSGKNFPAAYLTGLLLGKVALSKGLKEAVLDTGFKSPLRRGKIYAFLKGAVDAGLNVPHAEDIFPESARLSGQHIVDYAGSLSREDQQKRFAEYLKRNFPPEKITSQFEQIKKKINGINHG